MSVLFRLVIMYLTKDVPSGTLALPLEVGGAHDNNSAISRLIGRACGGSAARSGSRSAIPRGTSTSCGRVAQPHGTHPTGGIGRP